MLSTFYWKCHVKFNTNFGTTFPFAFIYATVALVCGTELQTRVFFIDDSPYDMAVIFKLKILKYLIYGHKFMKKMYSNSDKSE